MSLDFDKLRVPPRGVYKTHDYDPRAKAHSFENDWNLLQRHGYFKGKPRRTCVDIGSHVGIYALKYAQLYDRVVCFEPIDEMFRMLEENTKEEPKIEINNCAISNANSKQTMIVNTSQTERNFILDDDDLYAEHIRLKNRNRPGLLSRSTIETRTLDSFNLEEVDLIKIDTEGVIMNVLEGAEETLTNNSPFIHIEVCFDETKKPMLKFFEKLGYETYTIWKTEYFLRKV